MFNGYYDIARFDRFTPYVGAGVGLAYNKTGGVSFTGNAALVNVIEGDNRWSLAWSLMAGVGVQLTERTTLDIGYRYLDMGKAEVRHHRQRSASSTPRCASTTSPPTSSRSACASPSAAARPAAPR